MNKNEIARTGGMALAPFGAWAWTEQTYEILGFREGDVPATTSVFPTHVHPDSRERASGLLDPAARGLRGGSLPSTERRALDQVASDAMADRETTPLPTKHAPMTTARDSVPGLAILAITGELDLRSGPPFTAELVATLGGRVTGDVLVVDLTRTTHVGAVALSVLEGLVRRCARQQVALRVGLPETQRDRGDGLRRAGASVHAVLGEALAG